MMPLSQLKHHEKVLSKISKFHGLNNIFGSLQPYRSLSGGVGKTQLRKVLYGGASNERKPYQNYKRYFGNLTIGVFGLYSVYAICVVLAAADEINIRKESLANIENRDTNHRGTLVKYSPLKVFGRYENPFEEYRVQTIYEFFFNRVVEVFQRNRGGIPNNQTDMDQLMPIHQPDWKNSKYSSYYNDAKVAIENVKIVDRYESISDTSVLNSENSKNSSPVYNTWLGQSCNYIYYKGLKILTDPLFSDFLVHETLGPQRITRQPCHIDEIPKPDIILVSHNHPDHLDVASIEKWSRRDILWIVPVGLGEFLRRQNVQNIIELSWWESCEVEKAGEKYHFSCTPAMHWSGRGLTDINHSLWCSFLFSHNGAPILFHAGDTGYVGDLFKRIKQKYGGGCKLALLPCGQYCPEWHQRPRHINPTEVFKIVEDMEIKNALGVHWGTFVLSGEYFREPKERLEMLSEWKGKRDHCYCPELGKTIKFT